MEDFHKRSINASRHLAAHNVWRPSDGATGGAVAIAEHDDWNPVDQADPSQPEWDAQSAHTSPRMNIPGSPGSPGQWRSRDASPQAVTLFPTSAPAHYSWPTILG